MILARQTPHLASDADGILQERWSASRCSAFRRVRSRSSATVTASTMSWSRNGLIRKVHSACLHRPDRHWNVAVAGHKDDGNGNVRFRQLVLEVKASEPRQSDVKHKAAHHVRQLASEQLRGRTEQVRLEADQVEDALSKSR